jgi:hypothetical protein
LEAVAGRPSRPARGIATYVAVIPLDQTDEETVALIEELRGIIENAKFPLSPRIQMLRAIFGKLRPEPARETLPPPRHYEPPRAKRRR